MDIEYDELVRILELFQSSDFAYLSIKIGNVSVTATQNGANLADFESADHESFSAVANAPSGSDRRSLSHTAPEAPEEEAPVQGVVDEVVPAVEGTRIVAPMVGTFYVAPSPEEAPYVTVGQTVAAGETLGLIEAMKMFTAIEATADGTVVAVLAKTGEFVEFGQPLFVVDVLTN